MRPEKKLLLNEIKDKIDQAHAIVLTRYQKMDPNLAYRFRVALGQAGSGFEVVRKRILVKAAQEAGVTLDADLLEGHIGIVYTDQDPLVMTKSLYKFSQENEEVLEVLAGRFEGQVCSAKDVKLIAELPTKEQMRSQLLGVLEAPMAQALAVVEALLSSPIYCLDNKAQAEQN